jgi:hypothetical protein
VCDAWMRGTRAGRVRRAARVRGRLALRRSSPVEAFRPDQAQPLAEPAGPPCGGPSALLAQDVDRGSTCFAGVGSAPPHRWGGSPPCAVLAGSRLPDRGACTGLLRGPWRGHSTERPLRVRGSSGAGIVRRVRPCGLVERARELSLPGLQPDAGTSRMVCGCPWSPPPKRGGEPRPGGWPAFPVSDSLREPYRFSRCLAVAPLIREGLRPLQVAGAVLAPHLPRGLRPSAGPFPLRSRRDSLAGATSRARGSGAPCAPSGAGDTLTKWEGMKLPAATLK